MNQGPPDFKSSALKPLGHDTASLAFPNFLSRLNQTTKTRESFSIFCKLATQLINYLKFAKSGKELHDHKTLAKSTQIGTRLCEKRATSIFGNDLQIWNFKVCGMPVCFSSCCCFAFDPFSCATQGILE